VSRSAPLNWNPRCKQLSAAERCTLKQWQYIKARCINPKHPEYKRCGARGIVLHGNWFSFPTFLAEVGPRPSSFHSLHRMDTEKGFVPGNLKWMTKAELASHRRTPDQQAAALRNRFMKKGSFDWDAWRAAGSPDTAV
jgi:hypothetical protein